MSRRSHFAPSSQHTTKFWRSTAWTRIRTRCTCVSCSSLATRKRMGNPCTKVSSYCSRSSIFTSRRYTSPKRSPRSSFETEIQLLGHRDHVALADPLEELPMIIRYTTLEMTLPGQADLARHHGLRFQGSTTSRRRHQSSDHRRERLTDRRKGDSLDNHAVNLTAFNLREEG